MMSNYLSGLPKPGIQPKPLKPQTKVIKAKISEIATTNFVEKCDGETHINSWQQRFAFLYRPSDHGGPSLGQWLDNAEVIGYAHILPDGVLDAASSWSEMEHKRWVSSQIHDCQSWRCLQLALMAKSQGKRPKRPELFPLAFLLQRRLEEIMCDQIALWHELPSGKCGFKSDEDEHKNGLLRAENEQLKKLLLAITPDDPVPMENHQH